MKNTPSKASNGTLPFFVILAAQLNTKVMPSLVLRNWCINSVVEYKKYNGVSSGA